MRCPCGGTFHGVSLSVEERIERRLGRHWLQRCNRCGRERVVETTKQKKDRQAREYQEWNPTLEF